MRLLRHARPFILLAFCVACDASIAQNLDQAQAIEMATTLRAHEIPARPVIKSDAYAVRVRKEDREQAQAYLVDLQLFRPPPQPQSASARDGLDNRSSTRRHEEERAATIAQSLRAMPGISDARVTLTLCDTTSRLGNTVCPNPNRLSAVLILQPHANPPETDSLIRWLALSAPQVESEDVSLLITRSRSVLPPPSEPLPAAVNKPTTCILIGGGGFAGIALIAASFAWRHRRKTPPTTALTTVHTAEELRS